MVIVSALEHVKAAASFRMIAELSPGNQKNPTHGRDFNLHEIPNIATCMRYLPECMLSLS